MSPVKLKNGLVPPSNDEGRQRVAEGRRKPKGREMDDRGSEA
jgi:hypothetical protein